MSEYSLGELIDIISESPEIGYGDFYKAACDAMYKANGELAHMKYEINNLKAQVANIPGPDEIKRLERSCKEADLLEKTLAAWQHRQRKAGKRFGGFGLSGTVLWMIEYIKELEDAQ